MRFSTISAALAFVTYAYAADPTAGFDALTSPTQDQSVAAGSTLKIVWSPTAQYNTESVSIALLQGATPATLDIGPVVVSSIASSAGTYSWTVPSDAGSFATYGFKLSLVSNSSIFQYSFPFHITSSTSSSTTSGSVNGAASTVTKTLATGTAYTPTSTPIVSVNSTSSASIKTQNYNSTTLVSTSAAATGNSTTLAIKTSTAVATTTAAVTTKASSTSTGAPSAATTNAAMANIASGSLAMIGGLVLAFAM